MVEGWHDTHVVLLGKQVEVVMAHAGDPINPPTFDEEPTEWRAADEIVRGRLLAVADSGEFEILDEMGFVHHCWPMLEVREL